MKVLHFTIPVTPDRSVTVQEEYLPWFYNQLHRHKEIQITLILKGKGTLIAGNHMHKCKDGDIYILGANQQHIFKSDAVYFKKNNKNSVHTITIFFDAAEAFGNILCLPEMREIKKFLVKTACGLQVPQKEKAALTQQILNLSNLTNSLLLADFIKLLNSFTNIKKWKNLSPESTGLSISDSEGLRMNDIYQYTITHFTENISLSEVASISHLTIPAFCKYFKKHTQKTYITFLNEIRINEACNKIMEGKFDGISSIAYDIGFNNVTSFNRVFKKITGTSPNEYRKNLEYKMNDF